MNFKIENNIVNITNYTSMERHFEKMASKGWLIRKIFAENTFIYKKIKSEELDFSISPYEVETMFSRKSDQELEEYQSVCESVGWNFASKYRDFHIYFKDKNAQAMEIQTDQEEEFKVLEKIGKKQTGTLYFQIVVFMLLGWFNLNSRLMYTDILKSGFLQILTPLLLIIIIESIKGVIDIKVFLRKSRKNIELGKDIEHGDSKFYFEKTTNILKFLLMILFFIQLSYVGLVLEGNLGLIAMVPGLLGIAIGALYSKFIKPSRVDLTSKVLILGFVLIAGLIISSAIGVINMGILSSDKSRPDVSDYKALSASDFAKNNEELDENLRQDFSLLVPINYGISSFNEDDFIETDYSKSINEKVAIILFERHIKQKEDLFKDIFEEPEIIKDGIIEKNINPADKKVWNVDQAYFLNESKLEIVLRKDKEVFYLRGKDFSDPEVIRISKEKLQLK